LIGKPEYDAENLSSVLSLVTSTGGVALMPPYVKLVLPSSAVIRRLQGVCWTKRVLS